MQFAIIIGPGVGPCTWPVAAESMETNPILLLLLSDSNLPYLRYTLSKSRRDRTAGMVWSYSRRLLGDLESTGQGAEKKERTPSCSGQAGRVKGYLRTCLYLLRTVRTCLPTYLPPKHHRLLRLEVPRTWKVQDELLISVQEICQNDKVHQPESGRNDSRSAARCKVQSMLLQVLGRPCVLPYRVPQTST